MSLPAFLRDREAAWRWAQDHLDLRIDDSDEFQREADIEQYQSRAATYATFAQKAARDGRLVVFRMVCVPSVRQIELHNLGKAWSATRRGAGCYNPTMGWGWGKPTREILVTGIVSTSDIDWQ